ncbi:MAG: citramalate synthase [Deltaproteobacteria bacterium]|nr:MAG: citramalate synthase [Deltaproteobacteria bacterium]
MDFIWLYDTTLRDGTQGENISFTAEEKLKIAMRLDDFGMHYIEGGWPGSNPRDMQFFELAKEVTFSQAKLAAFGATRKPGTNTAEDPNIQALIASEAPVITIFGKTWDLHVQTIMNNTLEENRTMIYESVAYLKSQGREVIYDAEHFFDGYKDNRNYAIDTLAAAQEGGAAFLVLCDTNGGSLPSEVVDIIDDVKTELKKRTGVLPAIGIHTHNDSGLAVANTIEAVRTGATMVQGTINGYGERCGNADLTSIIPIIALKMPDKTCISDDNLTKIRKVSRFVSETANMIPLASRPFVGKSAFAHKGGVHVSAVMKESRAYEHIPPERVGNAQRVLMSDLSGKSNVEYKAKELGIDLDDAGADSRKIVEEIKRLEQEGYQFDVADGSFKIFMEKVTGQFSPYFELKSFRIGSERDTDSACHSYATIKLAVNDQEEITADEGHGPVSALDNALRKGLNMFFPGRFDTMHLIDYKVRVMDGRDGTSAKVRVLITTRDADEIWSTVGVSEDIIEASWQALTDSFQFKLAKEMGTE